MIVAEYRFNNINKTKNKFKCYDCGQKFDTYDCLVKHAEKYHKDLIGDEDIHKYLFDNRNPNKSHICVICKVKECVWNPVTKKYSRFCTDPNCKKKARDIFRKNMIRIYNKDTLLNDPEHQLAMLNNRKISGIYTFKDGMTISYVGSYELDFLNHCTNDLKMASINIMPVPSELYVKYWDPDDKVERFYIQDFYMPEYDLVIEIKDSSKYPLDSKTKVLLKEDAVLKLKKFNYIKIVDKDYKDFDKLIEAFKRNEYGETKNNEKIIIIPK